MEDANLIVAFDTFFLARHFRNVGIYEYATNLLREFRKLPVKETGISVRYFIDPSYTDDSVDRQSALACEAFETRFLRYHRLWRLGLVHLAARSVDADMIFSPSPSLLRSGALPTVVTIHDAMPEKLPPEFLQKTRSLKIHFRRSAKLAYKVLTDSEHSKNDLVDVYNLRPEKVVVVYLGYDRDRFNSSPPDPVAQAVLLQRLGIHRPYILHHGMVQHRKNLGRLVRAYDLLLKHCPDTGMQLVLAGPLGKGSEAVCHLASSLNGKSKITFTGPLDGYSLSLLVKGASLCVIPSLYEGFCLPMVEAMACGIPTAVANCTSMPEISGGVLRYFDPLSVEDMTATMADILDNSELRAQLAKAGLQRAAAFGWDRCARETLQAFATPIM